MNNNFDALFYLANDLMFVLDETHRILEANDAAPLRLGYTRSEMRGRSARDLISPGCSDDFEKRLIDIRSDHPRAFISEMSSKNGTIFPVELSGRDVIWCGVKAYALIARDITERHKADLRLRESDSKWRLLFDNMTTGFALHEVICGEDGRVIDYRFLDINPAYEKLTGLRANTIVGRTVLEVLPGTEPYWIDVFGRVAMSGEPASYENYSKELGRWYHVRVYSPQTGQFAVIVSDITEIKSAEERIQYLAKYDALTGLPNRAELAEKFNYALTLVKRASGYLAVLFVDIDRFKDINDSLGHSIGDSLLVEISSRLKQIMREQDTASRHGGDEFIVILPGCDDKGAATVAQKIREVLSVPIRINAYDFFITVSVGIAVFPVDGTDLESLSQSADTAMYRAKQEGRDCYKFFTPEMQIRADRRLRLANCIRLALERCEFQLHYQPLLSIGDRRLVGVEALLRWHSPEMGLISPAEFIPVAEESGSILALGEWVLRRAAAQLKRWLDQGYRPLLMAVNLSALQFRHPSLLALIDVVLRETGVPPHLVEFELTESIAMHDPEQVAAIIEKMRDLGVRIAIDDFGTGYSSLNYLKRYKINKIKIDRSFIRDLSSDEEDRAIVAAIISMSKKLGLQTIAEGVETGTQLAYLEEQGCNEAQGYYFSKPLPPEAVEAIFEGNPGMTWVA